MYKYRRIHVDEYNYVTVEDVELTPDYVLEATTMHFVESQRRGKSVDALFLMLLIYWNSMSGISPDGLYKWYFVPMDMPTA